MQTEWEIVFCVCVVSLSLLAANTDWLKRRHAFIYSSTFWELAMRDKVNTLLQARTP